MLKETNESQAEPTGNYKNCTVNFNGQQDISNGRFLPEQQLCLNERT